MIVSELRVGKSRAHCPRMPTRTPRGRQALAAASPPHAADV